ncbi:Hsp20/alpha crystallin family protein [Lichenifustis flavocetrariae]|uniref:Hsp20/alpha crystallin family protein n=1 Tax=Lichenifustis flavocetrariae TaxID=2949735 RepID=A0AA42CLD9_9HYPH|nr:Hsp20/alpha crystallin family protein [Lichenifustis flavocetrariae]MCW6510306.1 Hsp20/alpha crystallin family protein [Lichenifustis flavocetrariae]
MAQVPQDWMWSEAIAVLARADRLHDQFFRPRTTARRPAWEPPVDVIETDSQVLILIALPGVAPDQVEAVLEEGCLVVSGRRVLPRELLTAVIHRLELPQGRFERRIPVPPGRYDTVESAARDGCLVISLHKAAR